MKYDKSLESKEDKELWNFLQGGVFSDNRDKCIELRKQSYTKKEIVDMFRPIYERCNDMLNDKLELLNKYK
uniref:Uncharacterized protein n=1 Tax=viral metagenome TaxID=1070528 RepID=A0A6H1ZUS8_9ZZZZ